MHSYYKNFSKPSVIKTPDNIDAIVEDEGFSKLPISLFHDPFDRMLIAQAEGLDLLTADKVIPQYGLRVIDAKL